MNRWVWCMAIGALLVVGCAEADLGECPPNSDAQQLQGKQVMEQKCNNCHASGLSGSQRQDAPDDLNFDNASTVSDEAAEMYGEAEEGEMPPGAPLSSDELEAFRVYLACGATAK